MLLVHAVSQGVAPEFALPVYPVFVLTALAALAGERNAPRQGHGRPARSLASSP